MGFQFPGKILKDASGQVVATHALDRHSVDVAMAAKALLGDDITRRALAKSGGLQDLTAVQIERLAVFAYWHDVGKASTGFAVRSIASSIKGRPAETGHVDEVFALMSGSLEPDFRDAFGLEIVRNWFHAGSKVAGEHAACDFLLAAISHHGQPVRLPSSRADLQVLARAWRSWKDIKPAQALAQMGLTVRTSFPAAFDSTAAEDRLPTTPLFQHRFAGLVMLADWIASNVDYFVWDEGRDDRAAYAGPRAEAMTKRMKWGASAFQPIQGKELSFDATFGFAPNAMQTAIDALPLPASGSVVDIESDTGTGKTEAGCWRAIRIVEKGLASGIYFALPSRTSAVQIHGRIIAAMKNLLGADCPPVLLAVPGYLRMGGVEGRRLPNFRIIWNDGGNDPARWASENPKRFLAAPVVIGTIDQALMSVIRTGHAHMRGFMMMRMALVVDEVHASDARLHMLARELVNRHVDHGGHAVLMSATFGSTARRHYLKEAPLSLEEAVKLPYPAISMVAGDGERVDINPKSLAALVKGRSRRIKIEQLKGLHDPEAIALTAFVAAAKGARVLVVRNTVSGAVAVQRAIEGYAKARGREDVLFKATGPSGIEQAAPHHSRYQAADRKLLDGRVEAEFGKTRPAGNASGGGKVLIATQTVEQSIDIDCDLILTDLAPMDVLIQRLGRLHRHVRKDRPEGFKTPRAIFIVPETRALSMFIDEPRHGLGRAYPDIRVLEATWREIEVRRFLQLPLENRELVEKTTHPEALSAIAAELGLANHEACVAADAALAEAEAKASLIDLSKAFGDHALARSEAAEDVRVRLGAMDALVKFEPALTGPFGHKLPALAIPGWMASRDPQIPDEQPEILSAEDGVIRFKWGWRQEKRRAYKPTFRYSRFGLELDIEFA